MKMIVELNDGDISVYEGDYYEMGSDLNIFGNFGSLIASINYAYINRYTVIFDK